MSDDVFDGFSGLGADAPTGPLDTPAKIKAYSDAIFGAAVGGTKTAFEIDAMLKARKGQPVTGGGAGAAPTDWSSYAPWIAGGAAIIGLLWFMKRR
jgi:hypothetical protein